MAAMKRFRRFNLLAGSEIFFVARQFQAHVQRQPFLIADFETPVTEIVPADCYAFIRGAIVEKN